MDVVDRLLTLAREELGTREEPAGSNNVKYNTAYYGRAVNGGGYAWCAVFLWWLFQQTGVGKLYYGGGKTAYVPTLLFWASKEGLTVKTPQPGDLVCFDFDGNGRADHVGICESWDGAYVITIDGNTGTASEANGGCVMRRRRAERYILGVIRPNYGEVEENMTDEQFERLMEQYLRRQGLRPPPETSARVRAD